MHTLTLSVKSATSQSENQFPTGNWAELTSETHSAQSMGKLDQWVNSEMWKIVETAEKQTFFTTVKLRVKLWINLWLSKENLKHFFLSRITRWRSVEPHVNHIKHFYIREKVERWWIKFDYSTLITLFELRERASIYQKTFLLFLANDSIHAPEKLSMKNWWKHKHTQSTYARREMNSFLVAKTWEMWVSSNFY